MDVRVIPMDEFETHIPDLALILCECVAGGAAVHFTKDLDQTSAENFWQGIGKKNNAGELIILGAFADGTLAGTVSLLLDEIR